MEIVKERDSMNVIYRQTQLYKFLDMCNNTPMEKSVLDCGAGGNCPPLGMFFEQGYKTFGIELDESQIGKSRQFEEEHGMKLNISKGDMRCLPFENEDISFVYSYNAIFHMTKADIAKSISEMKRVLKAGGLLFVTFLIKDDFRFNVGELIEEGSFLQPEGDDLVIHSYFDHNEGEKYFDDMELVYKEIRVFERMFEGEWIKQGYVDYILKKK